MNSFHVTEDLNDEDSTAILTKASIKRAVKKNNLLKVAWDITLFINISLAPEV